MRDDDEVRAVRAFMTARVTTRPSPALRHRVLAPAPRPRRRVWTWAVPVLAAVVALAVVTSIALVVRGKSDIPETPPPAVVIGGPLDVAAVLQELERNAAKTKALAAPDGSYLYTRRDIRDDGRRQTLESWKEPQGLIMVEERENGQFVDSHPSIAELAGAARSRLATAGPDPSLPTPAWLAQLPTDTVALQRLLDRGAGDSPMLLAGPLLVDADPFVPGPQRAALIRLMATAPGLTALEVTIGGHRRYAIRWGDGALFFDPATAHVVGEGQLQAWSTPGPSAGPAPDRFQLYTYEVVPNLPR